MNVNQMQNSPPFQQPMDKGMVSNSTLLSDLDFTDYETAEKVRQSLMGVEVIEDMPQQPPPSFHVPNMGQTVPMTIPPSLPAGIPAGMQHPMAMNGNFGSLAYPTSFLNSTNLKKYSILLVVSILFSLSSVRSFISGVMKKVTSNETISSIISGGLIPIIYFASIYFVCPS